MNSSLSTILVVDDNAELADTYAMWLEDEYDVRTAYSGKSGIAQFDDGIDLVLLDRRMPNYSGDEVLKDIRAHDHDCPVAMLTAVNPDVDIVDLPFDEYINKSVDRAELQNIVQRLINQAKSKHNNEVLNVLGDQKARHCLSYLVDNSATAKEIGNATRYSLPTVYRRLNALNQANLIEEQTQIDPDGNHVKTFTAVAEQVRINIADGFQIEIDPPTEPKRR